MDWTYITNSDQVSVDNPFIFRQDNKQICIWRKPERILAFDNRCPHEGYPLKEGNVDGRCVLTCHWHNWKFDLAANGRNLHERDRLRTYPVREKNGQIFLDLREPSPEEKKQALIEGLYGAFKERQYGRLARGLSRFEFEGLDPRDAIAAALEWSYDKLEFGTRHGLAVAPDWLSLANETHDPDQRLTYLTEIFDHLAFEALRMPTFPYTEDRKPYSRDALASAIEKEDEITAIALINGAEQDGKTLDTLSLDLAPIILEHYRGFGHPLIYLTKVAELNDLLGGGYAYLLLKPLIRYTCIATREDLLPEFRHYKQALSQLDTLELKREQSAIPNMPFRLSVNKALDWTVETLKTHAPEAVLGSLLAANARNMLGFDLNFGKASNLPVAKNFDWLDMTHGITMANALRKLATRDQQLWKPGLLQVACFVGRAKSFMSDQMSEEQWRVEDQPSFWQSAFSNMADHGYDHPIYPCHHVKTALAIREEMPHLDAENQQILLAALHRFLNSPFKTKHGLRLARQARDLVSRDYARNAS